MKAISYASIVMLSVPGNISNPQTFLDRKRYAHQTDSFSESPIQKDDSKGTGRGLIRVLSRIFPSRILKYWFQVKLSQFTLRWNLHHFHSVRTS